MEDAAKAWSSYMEVRRSACRDPEQSTQRLRCDWRSSESECSRAHILRMCCPQLMWRPRVMGLCQVTARSKLGQSHHAIAAAA